VERVLHSLENDERDDMKVNGVITITCEFCKTERIYDDNALMELDKSKYVHQ
jgi:redox-regulated HSP33 family molecular chaperone